MFLKTAVWVANSLSPDQLLRSEVSDLVVQACLITKTRLFKYIGNSTSKNWKFSDKKLWYFFIFLLKNIDCGYLLEPPRRGDSDEYPQSMFLSRNKKNNVNPSFTV